MALKQLGPQNGLEVTPTVTQPSGQPPQVSVELENWYVRFLGIYLQFLAGGRQDGPESRRHPGICRRDDHHRDTRARRGDTGTEMYISVLGPIFTILGIPTWPGLPHAELQRA